MRIDIGYHGKHFFGSQRQQGVRTVQHDLEAALRQVTGTDTRVALAGRTDRGVHAVGQVASGRVNWTKDLERLRFAIDSVTKDDIVVYRVAEVDREFHARFSARRREYRYRVFVSERSPVLVDGMVWWYRGDLDLNRLNLASTQLIGEHDFRSFAGRGLGSGMRTTGTTVRSLDRAEWRELAGSLEPIGRLIEFRVSANAFLPHMVRNMVGALVEIGSGKRDTGWIDTLVDQLDRKEAPPPAPPEGLVLWKVDYGIREEPGVPGFSAGLEQE